MSKSNIKQHKSDEFVIKTMTRKGVKYYKVIDTYDMSLASLEISEDEANKTAAELNEMRNKRLSLTA